MEQLALPKVGDVVFEQSWQDTTCRGVVVAVEDGESYVEVAICQGSSLLWSSRQVESHDDEMAFGHWYDGNGLPCWFGDLDGDGHPELLAPRPKADLTPTVFRVFAWDGQQLSFSREAALLEGDDGRFVWSLGDEDEDGPRTWVDGFEDGVAQVVRRRRVTTSHRLLTLEPFANGFMESV